MAGVARVVGVGEQLLGVVIEAVVLEAVGGSNMGGGNNCNMVVGEHSGGWGGEWGGHKVREGRVAAGRAPGTQQGERGQQASSERGQQASSERAA